MQDIHSFNEISRKLREFFQEKLGFIEVPAQSRLSILAACEDPATITKFVFSDIDYPLPQTGQMWLEHEILKNPGVPGVFCASTSYRNESNPIPGRHDKIFPMFEFEAPGGMDALRKIESELVEFLGFKKPTSIGYEDCCKRYGVDLIEAEQEDKLRRDLGNAVSLEFFPRRTDPFWNMKHRGDGVFNKIDVILCGAETIGSAERATDPEEMRELFHSISEGKYAATLFSHFGRERVMRELDEYLSFDFFERFGGGIGVTRLARAMRQAGLLGLTDKIAA